MSGVFPNILTADNNYSPPKRGNLLQHFHMQLFRKEKHFIPLLLLLLLLLLLFAFSKFRFNFEHFQKNITLIADLFFNLRTTKNVVR